MIKAKISKLLAPKKLIFEDVVLDDKNLLPEEIFCKTLISTISPGTEISAYNGDPPLRPIKAYPRMVGYCNVAQIIAVGSGVGEYEVGQRILTFSSHCSHFICKKKDILSIVPENISSQQASTAYIFHLGYDAALNANIKYGSPVVVLGLGVIGLCTIKASKMSGGKVYAITNHDSAKDIALKMGANRVISRNKIDQLKSYLGHRLADSIITTSNSWSDWSIALDLAGMNAKICVLGFPGRNTKNIPFNPLDSRYFYHKQLQIQAVGHLAEENDSRSFLKFNEKDI